MASFLFFLFFVFFCPREEEGVEGLWRVREAARCFLTSSTLRLRTLLVTPFPSSSSQPTSNCDKEEIGRLLLCACVRETEDRPGEERRLLRTTGVFPHVEEAAEGTAGVTAERGGGLLFRLLWRLFLLIFALLVDALAGLSGLAIATVCTS